MPRFAHTLSVSAPPSAIFSIVDDVSQTPTWLSRCTGIDKLDPGTNDVGTRLRYHYADGRRTGVMDGQIVAREPDRHFAMKFSDRMMDVTVDFVAASDGVGTTLTHTIDIATKGFGRVFAPVIKRQLPKQTLDAMTALKHLAEERTTR
jgi:carbon monoxide dehydrogenase subunit G